MIGLGYLDYCQKRIDEGGWNSENRQRDTKDRKKNKGSKQSDSID